jgi:hypothetical protein
LKAGVDRERSYRDEIVIARDNELRQKDLELEAMYEE